MKGDDIDGRAGEQEKETEREERSKKKKTKKKDDSVDKVKLEIKPADGGAKNVTCQVACGTPGPDRRIRTVGR